MYNHATDWEPFCVMFFTEGVQVCLGALTIWKAQPSGRGDGYFLFFLTCGLVCSQRSSQCTCPGQWWRTWTGCRPRFPGCRPGRRRRPSQSLWLSRRGCWTAHQVYPEEPVSHDNKFDSCTSSVYLAYISSKTCPFPLKISLVLENTFTHTISS